MSQYDLIALVFLGLAAWKGFRKGFIREMAGLFGLFMAAVLAWMWMGSLGGILEKLLSGRLPALPVMSFAVLFGILILAFSLFAKFVTRLLDMTLVLGMLNRLAGAFLACLQVFLLLMLLTWLADRTGILSESTRQSSWIYPVTAGAAPALYRYSEKYFPKSEEWMDTLTEKVNDLRDSENVPED
jgi:membrane protein required for colicin V production